METRIRCACVVPILVAGALGLCSTGHAAVTVGSNIAQGPNTIVCLSGAAGQSTTCTLRQKTLSASATAPGGLALPSGGVLVRWRLVVGGVGAGVSASGRVRVLRSDSGAGSGEVHPLLPFTVHSFPERLPVKAGDRVAVDITVSGGSASGVNLARNVSGIGDIEAWLPPLADNALAPPSATIPDRELLLNADIEPDVDGDGYGDETQDGCLTQAGPTCIDIAPPVISRASLSRYRFRVDTSRIAARRPRGTTVRFTLSEPGSVAAIVERVIRGRKAGGKCKASKRKGKRCRTYKTLGTSLYTNVAAGDNRKPFSGWLRDKRLKPGPYRMTLVAVDLAGNRSAGTRLAFRVVR